MSICTDNERLGVVGCGATYSGQMCHSVARVDWSTHPDGRAHCTFPSVLMADRCWRGSVMRDPAHVVDRKGVAVFRRDDRGVWRYAETGPYNREGTAKHGRKPIEGTVAS